MILGINAINIKSWGGIYHLKNLLDQIIINDGFSNYSIEKIYIWSSEILKDEINFLKNNSKIIIIEKKIDNIFLNILWKIYTLNKEAKNKNCDLIFYPDGICLNKKFTSIILFQNLIPFDYKEIIRYGFTFQTIKLFLTFMLYSFSANNADGIIYLNKYGKKLITNKLNYNEKIKDKIIPHGISNKFRNLSKINDDQFKQNIIYVSTIDLYKHQWNLIKSVKLLLKENHNIQLHLVGGISNNTAYKYLIKEMDECNRLYFNSIVYYKHLKEDEIINLFKKSDLICFNSSCESMGLNLLEGMSTNIPIISSNLSGLTETIVNKEFCYNPFNIMETKNIIKYFLYNQEIKNKNVNLTKKISNNYNWNLTYQSTFSFIKTLYENK